MNKFALNREEYIRVNNNGGSSLANYYKYVYYTSFVITGDTADALPVAINNISVANSNDKLFENASLFCCQEYPEINGYACFIAKSNIVNSSSNVNVPYATVNVYIGYEASPGNPSVFFIEDENGNYIVTENDINMIIQ